jgi:hypothetical protein
VGSLQQLSVQHVKKMYVPITPVRMDQNWFVANVLQSPIKMTYCKIKMFITEAQQWIACCGIMQPEIVFIPTVHTGLSIITIITTSIIIPKIL